MASLRQLEKPEFCPPQACTLMARTQINLYLEILCAPGILLKPDPCRLSPS